MKKTSNIPDILIVDDTPANLKVLGDILKGFEYKVRPAPSGILALQAAEKEKPDIILLDIMMPEMDGYEVCRRLKANDALREIPVIFISALNDTNDIVKALQSGGVDYITKPFKAEEINARISVHLKISDQSKELVKLNADKDRFIAILAHDLKSPFNSILGFMELLSLNIYKYDIAKIEEQLKIINSSAHSVYNLIEDLLIWTRSQAGKLPFKPQKLNLSELCLQIEESYKVNTMLKDIMVNQLVEPDIIVYADIDMLKTILRNLFSNAIKFSNPGGQIDLFAEQKTSNIQISVRDYGTGIPPKILSKLFDLAHTQSIPGTLNETGTGLGLMLCKDFIEIHGGEIQVESQEGEGSTFTIKLPLNSIA
jgi:signal transduction histidine kinase